jgi:hypothetical protein
MLVAETGPGDVRAAADIEILPKSCGGKVVPWGGQ